MIRGLLARLTKNRMSAYKANQTIIFWDFTALNRPNSLKAYISHNNWTGALENFETFSWKKATRWSISRCLLRTIGKIGDRSWTTFCCTTTVNSTIEWAVYVGCSSSAEAAVKQGALNGDRLVLFDPPEANPSPYQSLENQIRAQRCTSRWYGWILE